MKWNCWVGGAALGWRCFGASDHGPVSFRRVGQSVDLPVKARRWGHDLRGSPQSGWLKSRSRPPQPRGNGPGSEVARGEPPPRSGLFGNPTRRWPGVRQSPVPHGPVLGSWPLLVATGGRRRAAGGGDIEAARRRPTGAAARARPLGPLGSIPTCWAARVSWSSWGVSCSCALWALRVLLGLPSPGRIAAAVPRGRALRHWSKIPRAEGGWRSRPEQDGRERSEP